MNKKQRNKKLVNQNKRNRLLNRRYKSLIKNLAKFLKSKIEEYLKSNNLEEKKLFELTIYKTKNTLMSIFDKAVKKKVYHKNTIARKKSKIQKFLNQKI